MPLNEAKIVQIMMDQCAMLPERCEGYHEELLAAIADIIQTERQHKVQGTNVQQRVNDKVNATGTFLARERGQLDVEDGESAS
jgi:hypothetical protein